MDFVDMVLRRQQNDAIGVALRDSQINRELHKAGDLYIKAVDIGRRAHKGQTRWGGEDYFEAHCVVVADSCELYTQAVTALLHDVKEDCEPEFWEEIKQAGFPPLIITALELLCHDPKESYADYIDRVGTHQLASYVKIKDLEHNLSDLKADSAAQRQRKDKYELARLYLKRRWNL